MTQIPSSQQPGSGTYPQRGFQPPPGATEVVLVRHGQSQEYVEGRMFPLLDGQGDPPLSALGYDQARLVCARLAQLRIDAIYVTTLCRTTQTATPLARELGLDLTVEPDLREVKLGEWEGGLFRKRVTDGHPTALRMFAEGRWDVIPGAEPAAAFDRRVRSALERLIARHADQRVAVFTHGGVIGQAIAVATGAQPMTFAASDNASISGLVATDGRWVVRSFNDTAHLNAAALRTGRPSAGRPSAGRPSAGRSSESAPAGHPGRPSASTPSASTPSAGTPSAGRPSAGRPGKVT